MEITVSGKHIELSDALHTRVWEEMNAWGRRYALSERMTAHVRFSRERKFFVCDIALQATGMELRSRGGADDAYRAFTLADQQLSERLAEARNKRYHRRGEPTANIGFRALLRPEPEE